MFSSIMLKVPKKRQIQRQEADEWVWQLFGQKPGQGIGGGWEGGDGRGSQVRSDTSGT